MKELLPTLLTKRSLKFKTFGTLYGVPTLED